MQIKTPVKYHLTSTQWLSLKWCQISNVGKKVEQNLLYIADGSIDIKWHNHFGKEWQFLAVSNKIKHIPPLWNLFNNFYRDVIYNFPQLETKCLPEEWLNKCDLFIYVYIGITMQQRQRMKYWYMQQPEFI